MNQHLARILASMVGLCSAGVLAESLEDPVMLIEDRAAWSTLDDASGECGRAADVLSKEETMTRPSQRYDAALTMRRCLQWQKTEALDGDPSRVAAVNQNFEPALEAVGLRMQREDANQNFLGMSLGVGVGVSLSDDDVISAAEIGADNVIRATQDDSEQPRVIMESHYYGLCRLPSCNAAKFGVGPYFGIVAKDDKILSAFSAGVMFGWQDPTDTSKAGFSVGIGALLDSDVKSLADGYEDGEPLPDGETEIRFRTESRWSGILFFTRTF